MRSILWCKCSTSGDEEEDQQESVQISDENKEAQCASQEKGTEETPSNEFDGVDKVIIVEDLMDKTCVEKDLDENGEYMTPENTEKC